MADVGAAECWRLLELASIHDAASDDGTDIDAILAGANWDLLIVAAIRHRMMPRVADFLIRSERMSFLPREFRRCLIRSLHENRFRCASSASEASRVVTALVERGVVVVCTKGVVFQASLYGGLGGRSFDDIDLMIHHEDMDRAAEVLLELGYLANLVHDLQTDRLTRLSRQAVAMYRMYPDHLPHFLRPLSGHALSHYAVDICFNITWYGATWQIPMSEVLAVVGQGEVTVGDEIIVLPVLTAPYDFIFTAMHLFREGWFERTITIKNLRLGQFADLWRQWHRVDPAGVATLAELIDKHAIAPPIAWVCHHLDEIFGSAIIAGLDLGDYCDDAWLHSASAMDGSYLSWTGSMRDRIRSGNPPRLSPAPEPRFAVDARVARR